MCECDISITLANISHADHVKQPPDPTKKEQIFRAFFSLYLIVTAEDMTGKEAERERDDTPQAGVKPAATAED